MGRNSRRKQATRNLKATSKRDSCLGYILYQLEYEDFLSILIKEGEVTRIGWCDHPSGAKVFSEESVAKQVAESLVEDKSDGYELMICRILDLPDEYRVEELERVVKVAGV